MDYQNKKHKKFDIIEKKKRIINSINDVNCFLTNLNKVYTIKKIFKK